MEDFEYMIKGPLFGCRMCGNCLLQETAFICPMECPKGLRNGPCGGSTPEHCYVDKTRPCIWYKIYERAHKMGREEKLLEVLPPLDWEKVGTEAWKDIGTCIKKNGTGKVLKSLVLDRGENRHKTWDLIFRTVRQPDWWQGDDKYHAPAYTEPVSDLEKRFKAGEFVVACEIAPPLSMSTKKLVENINLVKPYVTAINFTDNVWAELEPRTLAGGVSIGQSRGLAGNELQEFARQYVEEGQMQHRLANFALNGPVAFGRLGSLPGEAMSTLSNARLIGPVFKFIQPFQRVPSNIIKSAMRNTPAALFVDTWWRDIVSEDAFTRDRAIGEIVVGSSTMALVSMASAIGSLRFNGGGPIDPAARDKWTNIEKRMPYSIQFWDEAAGKWTTPTSMRALEPYATLFGAIGDYVDIANSLSTESRNRLGSSLVLTLARMSTSGLLSKSYFQGFNELYEAAFNPSKIMVGPAQRDPLSRYLSRIVASMVPHSSALRAARRETDQVTRSVDPSDIGGFMGFFQETLDEVRNAVPGWSNSLPARRDWINGSPILTQGILGAEIVPAEMPWLQAAMQFTPFAAFQQGRQLLGPVHQEMGMLSGKGTNFMGPRAADFGTEMRLTPSELEEYTIRFASIKDEYGFTFEQSVTQLIQSPQYQSWPVDGPSSRDVSLRAAAIQTEIQRYKKLAKEDFKIGTPKGQLIAAEEAAAEARKAERTYIQQYGMDNSPQPAQAGASWSPTPGNR